MNIDLELKIEIVGWSWNSKKVGSIISKYEEEANLEWEMKIYGLRCSKMFFMQIAQSGEC